MKESGWRLDPFSMWGCVSSTFNGKWKHYICICLKNDDINGHLALYVLISNLALKLTLIAKYVLPNGCELYWYVSQIQAQKRWGVMGTCQFTNAAIPDEYIHQSIRIASEKWIISRRPPKYSSGYYENVWRRYSNVKRSQARCTSSMYACASVS